jgi:quinol monooxygenase YgiN
MRRAWAAGDDTRGEVERKGVSAVAIKVIVELQAKPGRRDELESFLESLVPSRGPTQRGFLGSTRYEVLDDPDMLIEIAEWDSAEAREAHMEESASTGAYAPLLGMLAAPFRATVIRQRP